jgi:hypothetical protein
MIPDGNDEAAGREQLSAGAQLSLPIDIPNFAENIFSTRSEIGDTSPIDLHFMGRDQARKRSY